MLINRQRRMRLPLAALDRFVRRLKSALRLEASHFNVCFVDDREICRLNARYRGKAHSTDVLSFPWRSTTPGAASKFLAVGGQRARTAPGAGPRKRSHGDRHFDSFLGDIAISVETARRNAKAEGHSVQQELRWLILHGVLHLLGFDHEADHGEMNILELDLRAELGIDGAVSRRRTRQKHGRR